MDSFAVAYLAELLRVEVAKRLPGLWRAVDHEEIRVVGAFRRAGPLRKSAMVAALLWAACYLSVLPWTAIQQDPPVLTASVAAVGSIVALLVYSWWVVMSAVRSLRRRLRRA